MSVFESFIEELKEENLLEDVIVSKTSKNDSDEVSQDPADKAADRESRPAPDGDRNAKPNEPEENEPTDSTDRNASNEPKVSAKSGIQSRSDDDQPDPLPGVKDDRRIGKAGPRERVGLENDRRFEVNVPEPEGNLAGERSLDEIELEMEANFKGDRRFEIIEPEHRVPADSDRRFEVIEPEHRIPADSDRRFEVIEPEQPAHNYIDRRFDEIEPPTPVRYVNDRRFEVIEPEPPVCLDNKPQFDASEPEEQPDKHFDEVESEQDWTINDKMPAKALEPERETPIKNEPHIERSDSRNNVADDHSEAVADYLSISDDSDNGAENVGEDPSHEANHDKPVSPKGSGQMRAESKPLSKNTVSAEFPDDEPEPITADALSNSELYNEAELEHVPLDNEDLERSEGFEAEDLNEHERTAQGENGHKTEMGSPDVNPANDDPMPEGADSVGNLEEEMVAPESVSGEEDWGPIDGGNPSAEVDLPDQTPKGASEKEIYSQRIVDEVASLQVVEHVLDGIVRQQKRSVPRHYDVVPVKQALHKFLNEFKQLETVEQTASESNLRKEIESWHAALLNRDDALPTEYLRRYCEENSMNSKALVALARFYRNSHFSETVRSKFDLVVTRLFSKDVGNNKRQMVLERDELIASLNELYADWSSIPVYSDDDEDSELVLSAFKFEDFINEAKKCTNFDLLISSRFFKRIKTFKKNTNENFFAPLLVASAIECNVAVGNQYVDLIEKEKKKSGAKRISDQYGRIHDSSISDATSKTLQLVELLKERKPSNNPHITTDTTGSTNDSGASKSHEARNEKKPGNDRKVVVFGIMALLGLIICGYFLYSSFYGGTSELTASEKQVKLERSFLHEFVKAATIKDETFSGEVTENWHELTTARKKEIVGKIYSVGSVKGFTRVELKDDSGRVVGATVGTEVQITEIP